MAKIVFSDAEPVGDPLEGGLDLSINTNHTRAVFTDDMGGGRIVMVGSNLKADAMDENLFSTGKIEKVVFQAADGEAFITVTGGNYSAKSIGEAAAADDASGVYHALFGGKDHVTGSSGMDYLYGFKGDDEIFGRGGGDSIYGGLGDDEMTGGKGQDYFVFTAADGAGHDIITDFHIAGSQMDHLDLDVDILSVKKAGGGDDTLITLETGGTILIEDVKRADFIDYLMMT
ncbi:MAG: hypothetical protein JWL86_1551 [Rhizobium sp.]|nr:hypothetical protein [Rhizobium sp.]